MLVVLWDVHTVDVACTAPQSNSRDKRHENPKCCNTASASAILPPDWIHHKARRVPTWYLSRDAEDEVVVVDVGVMVVFAQPLLWLWSLLPVVLPLRPSS